MNEPCTVLSYFGGDLSDISSHVVFIDVNHRVEAEDKIKRIAWYHRQRLPVIDVTLDVVVASKTSSTPLNSVRRDIHENQAGAEIFQKLTPSARSRSKLQYRSCGNSECIRSGSAPHHRMSILPQSLDHSFPSLLLKYSSQEARFSPILAKLNLPRFSPPV
jgi:hypothetical protein